MEITVLYFASYKENSGIDKENLVLDSEKNFMLSDILKVILTKHPKIPTPQEKIVAAVNEEYQPHNHKVYDGDIIALIPPVSGG